MSNPFRVDSSTILYQTVQQVELPDECIQKIAERVVELIKDAKEVIDTMPTIDIDSIIAEHENIGYEKGFRDGYAEAVDVEPIRHWESTYVRGRRMIVIRFGLWRHKATSMFIYDRIYRDGDKWTPLCVKRFRYVG